MRQKTVYVLNAPTIPSATTRVYVDMEGDPKGRAIYLIGVLVMANHRVKAHSLWANAENDEASLFGEFFDILFPLPGVRIYHYGTYEARALKRMLPAAPTEDLKAVLTEGTTNVLTHISPNVYFPTYSNSLKDIAQFLGYTWSADGATGFDAIVWRKQWERTRDDTLRKTLIRYNRDDCLALKLVAEFLETISVLDATTNRTDDSPTIKYVDASVSSGEDRRRYGEMNPAVEGFGKIVKCAYFDYQRSRVYVRTHPQLKAIQRRIRRSSDPKYFVNRKIEHTCEKCIYCNSPKLRTCRGKPFEKTSIDLTYSKTGIRRSVVKRYSAWYLCPTCKRRFVPPEIKNTHHFGDGLVSWAMYQYVANRMTFDQIKLTAQECFGIKLPLSRCHHFKQRLAAQYKSTVDNLFAGIRCGPLLHADETKIRLKGGSNGFVWIFSNMEEVVYMYRPTREAAFLQDVLSGFNGVLVTDFYSGYDSLKCPQQKCLVHLIRDLNNDLLKNPFDEELAAVAQSFAVLMQDIVGTLDTFGLRARYLAKHKKQANEWLDKLQGNICVSELAEKYRKRIVRYKDKLFVFLDHDGIPWNNNNAEHAVKPFAKYRRIVNGMITEKGLRNYLVLLSLHQTCRNKGVRFLDFLLSKEESIDGFCDRL